MSTTLLGKCLICESTQELTTEHLVPGTFWREVGVDPESDDVDSWVTTLCRSCNCATGALHARRDVIDFIANGNEVTRSGLVKVADWAYWVTLLLNLHRGRGVVHKGQARSLLQERFSNAHAGGGMPKGVRVFAARVSEYIDDPSRKSPSYAVARVGDPLIDLDSRGTPLGARLAIGSPVGAADVIGWRHAATMVLGRTYSSGSRHEERVDKAALSVGFERVHPPDEKLALPERPIDLNRARGLFMSVPFSASDLSLLPKSLRAILDGSV